VTAVALTVVAGAPATPTATAAAPYPRPVISGYVPLEANATRATMVLANAAASPTLDFTVGITNAGAGAVMFYDHWEDGYEADITNPVQASTQVWGDGDPVGGNAATFCGTRCAGDLLPAGAVFVLRNNIPTPRTSAVLWDGRDRVASTRGFTITAGGFSTPLGSVLSASASAYDTTKWGTDYWIPIGENMTPPSGTSDAFSTTSVQVMADRPDTVVEIDTDGDGDVDQTSTIDSGEVVFVGGGINRGARVRSSAPVQVHVGSGDAGAAYELRWFTLLPNALLTDDYVNPVGSSNDNQRTITYLFNHNPAPITVTPTCAGCSGTLTVPALGGAKFASPLSQAVRFRSTGGEPFVAVGAAGSESGAAPGSSGDGSANWDWGFGLVPTRLLTPKAVLGWAPGNSNNPPASPTGNRDDNPVWISTLAGTTLYVDFDGDPATGAFGPGCDGRYDREITVAAGASTRIFDNVDGDMTGASIYTCDGTLLAGAWGEDASNAPTGAPGFDAGYALIPSTAMIVDKSSTLGTDTNGDGRFGPGDIVTYDISIADAGALAFTDVRVTDAIPPSATYIPGSATYDDGSGTPVPYADTPPPAATQFPFDEGGAVLPTIDPGVTVHLRYQVRIAEPFPAGTSISNIVDVVSDQESGGDVDVVDLVTADLSLAKTVTAAPTYLGEPATFRLTVSNDGPDDAEGVEVTDALPAGLTFVSATPSAAYDENTGIWSAGDIPANGSATLDIVATVDALSVTNSAEITRSLAADPDSTPANGSTTEDDDATATVTVQPLADVSLTKQRISGPDASGATTFRLTLANAGPSPSSGVQVTDHPPTGALFLSATAQTSPAADGTFDGGTNVWTVPDLAPGGQAQMNVVYDTSAGPGTNYAQVTASNVDDPDSSPGSTPLSAGNPPAEDDEASAAAPALSDVSVTNVVSISPTFVGDLVTFTVTARNDGPNATSGVSVTDRLPAGLVFVGSSPSTGSYDPVTGVWSIGDLPSGGSESLAITARVMTPGAVTTTAELTAATVPDIDSTPNNGLATEDDQADATITTTAATIGDTVWFDRDVDFVRDGDEPGLAGVTVRAVWTNPGPGTDVTFTTTTDADGAWSIGGLPSGSYTITVDATTLPLGITTATRDRDGISTAHTTTLTVAGGATVDDIDFAYTGSGTLGDTIFVDADGNSSPGPGEGVAGAIVTLTWFGPDGVTSGDDRTQTTTTDQLGVYRFVNLPAGNFTVAVDAASLPAGLRNTVDPDGGNDDRSMVVLTTGQVRDDLDFGYRGTNAIGDTVFADTDADGVQDADEVGLGGVEVLLRRDVDLDGTYETTVATTRTSGAGTYRFDDLPAGRYRVSLSAPDGLTATTPTTVDVHVDAGDEDLSADFGLQPAVTTPGRIGDVVWNDLDGDGVFDDGEPGIAGVLVSLRADTDGDGTFETTISTQPTGPDGSYGFANLQPGSYVVSIATPGGRFPTTTTAHAVVLTSASTVDTADFGLADTPAATASIGDLVWDDANGDGVQDAGELGLSGVTVTLRRDLDADGIFETIVATTDTDSDGAYRFTQLSPGGYRAVVILPSGRAASTPTSVDVTLGAGASVTTVDFGLTTAPPATGTIGDRVWLDSNGNGAQDATEPGTNGVTVALLSDPDGDGDYDTTVSTTTTSGDGNYVFASVAPGSYRVVVTPPTGFAITTPAPPVSLAPGGTVDDADIGLTTAPPPPYDLALVKQAGTTGRLGETVVWTLTATNNGATPTPGDVRIVDELPSGLAFVSATGAGWSCTTAQGAVTCEHAAPLPSGASSSIEITTRITAAAGTTIVNAASLAAGGGEMTMANNTSAANVVVAADPPALTTPQQSAEPGGEPAAEEPTPEEAPTASTVLVSTGAETGVVLQLAIVALAIGFIVLGASRSRRREVDERP
jgi:uncharacterized repeat protein (TIGR01451 family)